MTVGSFARRRVALRGTVTDLSAGVAVPKAETYDLEAQHTYIVTGSDLPTA